MKSLAERYREKAEFDGDLICHEISSKSKNRIEDDAYCGANYENERLKTLLELGVRALELLEWPHDIPYRGKSRDAILAEAEALLGEK